MSNFYLSVTETVKPLVFAFPERFVMMCTAFFSPQTNDRETNNGRVTAAMTLQRMANDMDNIQPSLAAELRSFAARS